MALKSTTSRPSTMPLRGGTHGAQLQRSSGCRDIGGAHEPDEREGQNRLEVEQHALYLARWQKRGGRFWAGWGSACLPYMPAAYLRPPPRAGEDKGYAVPWSSLGGARGTGADSNLAAHHRFSSECIVTSIEAYATQQDGMAMP
ncbi:unnamed protein product [Mycena citricolor]|uniref:Uncharacterized protein n=1 Tax=Mycena citricolor TaxID=2018698 RepID=A0AAD2HKA2_9AGAR|nr:unnamed protein product [Mycena citricolor]